MNLKLSLSPKLYFDESISFEKCLVRGCKIIDEILFIQLFNKNIQH